MDEQNDLQESQELDEELNLDLEDTQEEASPEAQEDVEALRQRLADVEAKNKQLYARLKKQVPAEKPKLKSEEDIGETGTRLSKLELLETKRQFAWENNLSPDETDKVFSLTRNPTKETLKDPFIQAGLEGLRALKRVSEATPSTSGRAKKYQGKSFEDLSTDEQKQNYSDHVASLLKKK